MVPQPFDRFWGNATSQGLHSWLAPAGSDCFGGVMLMAGGKKAF